MSYLVLARKYRPRTLDEIVGQDVAKGTLRGAIEEERVGHAYLFSGPRGTGKTTTARALARSLNCEHGPTPTPCGECERCLAADSGAEADIVEIDAASHTGVDHIRDLRDQAAYMPMRARFKIYIVDEVHMLSRSAFNALLKTLEEPPPHVKFFFATTELHKVPDTIRSRCQLVRLEPLAERVIADRLDWVFEQESVEADSGVSLELARRARGGMRDALSMADQLLALVGDRPGLADLARLSGEGGGVEIDALLESVEKGDRGALFSALPDAYGGESAFLERMLEHLRACLHASVQARPGASAGEADEERARVLARAKRLGPDRLQIWLEELVHARERMDRLPSHARLILEVGLAGLCDERDTRSIDDIVQRLTALEQRLSAGLSAGAAPRARGGEPRATPEPRAARGGSVPDGAEAPSPAARERDRRPGGAAGTDASARAPSARATAPAGAAASPGEAGVATAPEPTPPRPPAPQPTATPTEATPARRPRPASTAETWKRFLGLLRERSSSLAEVLESKGKLIEAVPGRAVVQLSRLRDNERALAAEPRNGRLCSSVFAEVVGEPTDVVLQDTSATRPGHRDPYTQKVADLFGGRIEDEA